jgi:hypothetical protein
MEQKHRKCKTITYKVYFQKILLYRVETWTYTKREESKIQASEMQFMRPKMGKTKIDRIRNAHNREDFRMEDIQNQIEGYSLRWSGLVKRLDEHRIPERLLEMKMNGKKPRGRP